jgi:hypothetical protein
MFLVVYRAENMSKVEVGFAGFHNRMWQAMYSSFGQPPVASQQSVHDVCRTILFIAVNFC